MPKKNTTELPRAKTPESVGVSSREVQAFIDHCMTLGKELHSVIVIRHGKVAAEVYREPFAAQFRHAMYSVSKSVTATAIGFAIGEGILSLDTRFVDIFPEARKVQSSPYLEKLTVEDLLTLRSGLSVTPLMDKTKDRWFEDIIGSNWMTEPGTEFFYINENLYLLCCIIHRKCGMSVVDYLMPRLFEPLGIERPFWETCPRGIEAGGWGLMLRPMDLAKFMLTYLNGGVYAGKQVLPEGWAEKATTKQTETCNSKDQLDTKQGYGYGFWRCGGYPHGFRADGMFSQFGIAFEDLDAVVVINCGEINEQAMRDVVWQHFPKAFTDVDKSAAPIEITIPPYEKLRAKPRSPMEQKLKGRRIVFNKPLLLNAIGFPVSTLPLTATFMGKDKAGNITNIAIEPLENELIFSWSEGREVNRIHVGMDGEYRFDNIVLGQMPFTSCAIGCWNNENELEIIIRPMEAAAARKLVLKFHGELVTLKPTALPDTSAMVENLVGSVKSVFKSQALRKPIETVMPHLTPLVDMIHIGKIK